VYELSGVMSELGRVVGKLLHVLLGKVMSRLEEHDHVNHVSSVR